MFGGIISYYFQNNSKIEDIYKSYNYDGYLKKN